MQLFVADEAELQHLTFLGLECEVSVYVRQCAAIRPKIDGNERQLLSRLSVYHVAVHL